MISVRRASPYCALIASNSSRITCNRRSGLARIFNSSPMLTRISLYSLTIFSCSRPVRVCRRRSRMALAWAAGLVIEMLSRAGATASRSENLAAEFGLVDGGYRLSDAQACAILDLRLHTLTGLEQEKIVNEYKEILVKIGDLLDILGNPDRLLQVIREELLAIKAQYGDARRTEIMMTHQDLSIEDLITEEDLVVTLSHAGYAKAQPLSEYRTQKRSGCGLLVVVVLVVF